MNQLKALNLVFSSRATGSASLLWGVTPKGIAERDKRTLIRKTPTEETKISLEKTT